MPFVLRACIWRSLALLVVLELLLAPAILYWPKFRDNASMIAKLVPPSFSGVYDSFMQGGAESYVCGQHYFKGCNTLGIAAAVLFAMGAVAGESDRGTFEIWLARPVTRTRLLLERWVAGALAITLPVYLSAATIPWLLAKVGESMSQTDLLLCSTLQSLLLVVVFSITFLWSTLARRPVSVAFGMFFLTIAQFALYLIKGVTHYSLFRLADFEVFSRICLRDTLPWPTVLGLTLTALGSLGLSLWAFSRRTP